MTRIPCKMLDAFNILLETVPVIVIVTETVTFTNESSQLFSDLPSDTSYTFASYFVTFQKDLW